MRTPWKKKSASVPEAVTRTIPNYAMHIPDHWLSIYQEVATFAQGTTNGCAPFQQNRQPVRYKKHAHRRIHYRLI